MDPAASSNGSIHDEPPGAPRWVKLLGIALALVVVAAMVAMLLLGGDHGPGRHM
jgi:hypothetical protein